jgi:hypothetical protein
MFAPLMSLQPHHLRRFLLKVHGSHTAEDAAHGEKYDCD